jgi:hypothetical protein
MVQYRYRLRHYFYISRYLCYMSGTSPLRYTKEMSRCTCTALSEVKGYKLKQLDISAVRCLSIMCAAMEQRGCFKLLPSVVSVSCCHCQCGGGHRKATWLLQAVVARCL